MTTENKNKEEKIPVQCSVCGKQENIARYNENTGFAMCVGCLSRLSNEEESSGSEINPAHHPPRIVDRAPGRRSPYLR